MLCFECFLKMHTVMQQDIKYTLTTVSVLQNGATLGNSGLQEPAGVLRSSSVCSLCLAGLCVVRILIGGIC